MNNYTGGVNKVILMGQISRPPRWHKSGKNGSVLCFILTTRETYRHNDKLVEQINNHAVKLPEKCFAEELNLGQTVYIEGKLETITFTDEQAVKRYKTEVIVSIITLLN